MAAGNTRTPGAPTRREFTRGPANSKAILAAAHRLVEERGEQFTTQELIREAGVALQTFYRHYGGKDQLLLAVIADLIAGHCRSLEERGRALPGPVERLRFYIVSTAEGVVDAGGTSGPRFMTSQHWRLHQEYPEDVAAATKPYTDLIQAVLAEGREAGVLAPRDDERDAWLITKLVMSVFHHYAFAPDDPGIHTAADDLWQFCLAAVGGTAPTPPRRPMRMFRRT